MTPEAYGVKFWDSLCREFDESFETMLCWIGKRLLMWESGPQRDGDVQGVPEPRAVFLLGLHSSFTEWMEICLFSHSIFSLQTLLEQMQPFRSYSCFRDVLCIRKALRSSNRQLMFGGWTESCGQIWPRELPCRWLIWEYQNKSALPCEVPTPERVSAILHLRSHDSQKKKKIYWVELHVYWTTYNSAIRLMATGTMKNIDPQHSMPTWREYL